MGKTWKIFLIYLKIGAFTIGGGYAMIPLIEAEVVDKRKWMTEEEFVDMLAVVQSAPGLIAVNSAIYIGYKIGGLKEAVAASLGAVIPSFCIILIIANFFGDIRENAYVDALFKGARPAVVALIAAAVYKLGKKAKLDKTGVLILIVSLIAIVLLDIHPILLILAAAVTGLFISSRRREREE